MEVFCLLPLARADAKLRFKHFISGIDFLQMRPEHSRMVPAPPGRSSFCKEHPRSNGCVYQHLPSHVLEELGFGHDVELPSGLLKIGGLRIGLEICLDHALGELCEKELKPWERVDVQLIVSAGMNIASGWMQDTLLTRQLFFELHTLVAHHKPTTVFAVIC